MDKITGLKREPPEPSEYEKKKASFITRAIWTLFMIGGFFAAMFAGHVYILMIVTAVQIICFKEVIAIAQVPARQKNLPLTKSLNWYFLAITMYFLYGESVVYYFKHILLVDAILLPFATHHRFISFMLYILGKLIRFSQMTRTDMIHRLRLLRRLAEERQLSIPILAIRLGAHGFVLHRGSVPFHYEQCLRGYDLVLPAS
jgi:CDP-diglyceride synthetase